MKRYYRFLRFIKPYTPLFLIQTYRLCYKFYIKKIKILFEIKEINKYQRNYSKIIEVLKKKNKIKVAFFLIHDSVWKYDLLFKLFQENSRYEPFVVICPYIVYGEERMIEDLKKSEDFVKSKEYPYYITYNFKTKKWLDVNKELSPDIIFYTNPHQGLTKEEYYINNYFYSLNCYVPYAFMSPGDYQTQGQYNQKIHNLSWKLFYETSYHKKIAIKNSYIKGKNVEILGYPGLDPLIDNKIPLDVWKIKNKKIKRIIWAPHHFIDSGNFCSNFLEYADFIISFLMDNKDRIQIAFKPHPILKSKLYEHLDWGKDRTDKYYNIWNEIENGQLEEGEYIDLFKTSDAIIHDSGSFISEYLVLNKPSIFMVRNNNVLNSFNLYGSKALENYYLSYSHKDLISILEEVIFKGNDYLKENRTKFINKLLLPPNNSLASNNIFNLINSVIN